VARVGGDEFVIVLSRVDREGCALIARKILDRLQQPFRLDGQQTRVTASLGVSRFPEDGENPESLLETADKVMYGAKRKGKNTFCVSDRASPPPGAAPLRR
jgi:diguanylate cyclase (GGDEF)-like protein